MSVELPVILEFDDARVRILWETEEKLNCTPSAVVLAGSAGGFLSLANALIYLGNCLVSVIPIHQIGYVSGEVALTIEVDDDSEDVSVGKLVQVGPAEFVWRLSETGLDVVSAAIHSLGYRNNHLHLDDGMEEDDISVFCILG